MSKDSFPRTYMGQKKEETYVERWGITDAKGGCGEGNLGEVSSTA